MWHLRFIRSNQSIRLHKTYWMKYLTIYQSSRSHAQGWMSEIWWVPLRQENKDSAGKNTKCSFEIENNTSLSDC